MAHLYWVSGCLSQVTAVSHAFDGSLWACQGILEGFQRGIRGHYKDVFYCL